MREKTQDIEDVVLRLLDNLREAANGAGLATRPDDSYDDLFQRIFLTFVEEQLPTDRPVILTDYPADLPTLARRRRGSAFCERWELYLSGIEVANCYSEERDPERLAAYLDHARAVKSGASPRSALPPPAWHRGLTGR